MRETTPGEPHLEKDLQDAMHDAHPPSQEDEEGHHQLDEVVEERLELMEPPRRAVHEIGDGVGHRLGLKDEHTRSVPSCSPALGPAMALCGPFPSFPMLACRTVPCLRAFHLQKITSSRFCFPCKTQEFLKQYIFFFKKNQEF